MDEAKQTKIQTIKEHLDAMTGNCSFVKAEKLYILGYRQVVLCKDCKHWRYIPYLEKFSCCLANWHFEEEKENGFCSHGENRFE